MADQLTEPVSTKRDDHSAAAHLVPVRVLFSVCVGLLLLTWITVAVYWVNLGQWNLWIAMGIASAKALLVSLFFMHLRYDRPFNAVLMLGAVLFVLLFIGLTLMDTVKYSPYVDRPESRDYAPLIESRQQRG